jgi:CRP-like cAMP-binding protein
LLAIAWRRTFRRREVVFHAGDPGDALHLVRTGRFAVRALTPRGEVAIVHVVGPGQAFGEISLLLTDHERSATVEALEPATTFSIVRSEFTRLHRQHPTTTTM